jgi:HlyD family secretion protein
MVTCSSDKWLQQEHTYMVTKSGFAEKITVTGLTETKNTYSLNCPRIHTDATIVYLIDEGTTVTAGDTVCILEARELENNYLNARNELENAKAEYNRTRADLELQYLLLLSQVKSIETSTEISKLDTSQVKFASPMRRRIIDLEIQRSEIEKDRILKKLEFLKRINESELIKTELKIKQAETDLARKKERLDMLTITAPAAGILLHAQPRWSDSKTKLGDVVWDRMPLVEIPDLSEFQVKLLVNEADFKRIDQEQSVDIHVDAIPGLCLSGKIIRKTPMGYPVKRDSKVKVFEIFAEIDSLDNRLQPGLSTTCYVTTKILSDTLVVPLVSIFEKDSLKIVYVQHKGKFQQRTVTVGYSGENFAVISDGIRENDILCLLRPPDTFIIPLEEK